MITANTELLHTPRWRRELAEAIVEPAELLTSLRLPVSLADDTAKRHFPLRVPRGYVQRMEPGNRCDPLLLQVLPQAAETRSVEGYHTDPVGDLGSMVLPGVIHKYRGRVLLVATGACAIHCRYCFRRHFPYGEANPRRGEWMDALSYIASDPSVEEVILSGGDPLLLPDERLARLAEELERIAHLRRLRIHTRLPVVLPSRVDDGLRSWMERGRLQKVVVVHANHPNELDGTVHRAMAELAASGATLLNQSVLLRGVNDMAEVLCELSEQLFAMGVMPYYLHLLDKVEGAAHFEVSETAAFSLMDELRSRLPGYLVPRLVREEKGMPAKTPRC